MYLHTYIRMIHETYSFSLAAFTSAKQTLTIPRYKESVSRFGGIHLRIIARWQLCEIEARSPLYRTILSERTKSSATRSIRATN